MSNDTVISTRNKPTDVVNFKILLAGNPISGEYKIVSLNIDKAYNKISSAKVIIADGDAAAQDFAISSKDDALVPGSDIEISMGYHGQSATVFKGIITKHTIKSGKNKHSVLIIEAKDKTVKLTMARKNRCFLDKSDKDIIQSIVSESGYGGRLDMESTKPTHKEMVQYNATDWDFIVSRAEMNGMLVLTDGDKLIVKPPDTNQEAAKEITFGMDVIEFESEINAHAQAKKIVSQAWNYKDQKIEESSEATVSFKETGNLKTEKIADAFGVSAYHLVHGGHLDKDELQSWSNSRLLKSLLAKAAGRIAIKGTTEIKPGVVIKLKGFSKRFNGNVLVTGVRHNFGVSVWETDIQFGLPGRWFHQHEDIVEKPAAGLLPGVNGLQIGIVMQLENDPDKEDRVKIKLPLVDTQGGIWARVASLDAGNDRGTFFRPEINDEVIVGFLNDDPRHPVILGMLNSNGKPAPFQAKDDNHEKGFVTRSKMKMVFNDDKKTFTIETPKGKKIEVNDDSDAITMEDNHQNKVTMKSDGIILESVKDISLKSSAGSIKLEGLNVEVKASVKLSAQASAQAEIKSSGVMMIKGAIVNIN